MELCWELRYVVVNLHRIISGLIESARMWFELVQRRTLGEMYFSRKENRDLETLLPISFARIVLTSMPEGSGTDRPTSF